MTETAEALDSAELEATGQVSDWFDLDPDKSGLNGSANKIRLTFIPSAYWTSILSRQEVLNKGVQAITERLESGNSEDPALDAHRLGEYKTSLLEVAGETVALSLRQLEGKEPFEVVDGKLKPSELEVLVLDGLFWAIHNIIVTAHWTNTDQARHLFRRWVGEPI
jgi:hypothetical protein